MENQFYKTFILREVISVYSENSSNFPSCKIHFSQFIEQLILLTSNELLSFLIISTSFLIDLIPKYFCLPFACFCYNPQMLFFKKIHRLCKMIQASLNCLSKLIPSYFKLRGCLNIYRVINSKIKLQVTPVTLISFKQEAQSFEFFQKMASEIICKKGGLENFAKFSGQ